MKSFLVFLITNFRLIFNFSNSFPHKSHPEHNNYTLVSVINDWISIIRLNKCCNHSFCFIFIESFAPFYLSSPQNCILVWNVNLNLVFNSLTHTQIDTALQYSLVGIRWEQDQQKKRGRAPEKNYLRILLCYFFFQVTIKRAIVLSFFLYGNIYGIFKTRCKIPATHSNIQRTFRLLCVYTYIAHKIQKTFNVLKQCDEALNRTIAGTTQYCDTKKTNSKLSIQAFEPKLTLSRWILCVLCVLDHVLRLLWYLIR